MKISESWLRTFVNPPLETSELADALTFGGVEVEEIESVAGDTIFTTKPTPNRGDCLSILGMAREVAALTGAALEPLQLKAIEPANADTLTITLDAPAACPRYCGRLVRGVNAGAATPPWMIERIERSGIRSISAIVDITNYVMLELGQPLHAFDAAALEGGIRVRWAQAGEALELLNGEQRTPGADYLVIADEKKALALAGIMGGTSSSVGQATRDIFVESAYFAPDVIAGKSRLLGFGSESSFRFERGVDFDQTQRALDRATALVVEICGGRPGPVSEAIAALPERKAVDVRLDRARRVLGIDIESGQASDILRRLGFGFSERNNVFTVTPPSYRFDIAIEEDLIEELARIHGYDKIPVAAPVASAAMLPAPETMRVRAVLRRQLVERDYHEVVTYSFIDRQWEQDFCGNAKPLSLANPIASHMSVMRSSLIPGLVNCVAFNVRHKQPRVRIFEIGRCFTSAEAGAGQPQRVGAAAYGDAFPEQWGVASRRVDFYDIKGDLETFFAPRTVGFEAAEHPALHPGKSARLVVEGAGIGWLGELHPRWQQKYDLPQPTVLFEVDYQALADAVVPAYSEIPKFPPVRRDLAALFDENVPYQAVIEALRRAASPIVTDVRLFDVYWGKDLGKGRKSLAFRVLLQDTRKTLTDAEVESAISELRETLRSRFDATLR